MPRLSEIPTQPFVLATFRKWLDETFIDLGRQFRWSYLPPLMVYLAAGVSSLTAIVGTFFVKDYLGLSAAFIAGLAFWAGIPWALKMPLGHLVDLIWRWKAILVFIGAGLIATSILVMYGLIAHTETLQSIMAKEAWYVLAALLAPAGYVVQDVVADAMTVEAVPLQNNIGKPFTESEIKAMHTTMQTLGRFAIIGGTVLVAIANISMFSGVELMSEQQKIEIYADIYMLALAIPLISVLGVVLGAMMLHKRAHQMLKCGVSPENIRQLLYTPGELVMPNWWILGGSVVFVIFTILMGLSEVPFSKEIIFAGSMAIILFMMQRLFVELEPRAKYALIGTAVIIFVFRAVPLPGPGATWFEIDTLKFDQQFLSILTLIVALLTLVGIVILRPLMAKRSIAYIVALLTVAGGVLSLPNIAMYYGLHEWTAGWSAGIIDAKFIAILDTALESPLGQIAMIPMLAWIAKNAPSHLKATFFAVMASFTNLALSASSLLTKYLNQIYTVTRETVDQATGEIQSHADYSELGWLLITVAIVGVALPLAAITIIQRTRLRTDE